VGPLRAISIVSIIDKAPKHDQKDIVMLRNHIKEIKKETKISKEKKPTS